MRKGSHETFQFPGFCAEFGRGGCISLLFFGFLSMEKCRCKKLFCWSLILLVATMELVTAMELRFSFEVRISLILYLVVMRGRVCLYHVELHLINIIKQKHDQ